MKNEQLNQLLYEALETEMGGVQVYQNAIKCAVNDELKEEWQKYLEQTQNHEKIVRGVCEKFGLDPEAETPGRKVVRHMHRWSKRCIWHVNPPSRPRRKSSPLNVSSRRKQKTI